jgi:hypothetical protein
VKRFGLSTLAYDERRFISPGKGTQACLFDHSSLKPEKIQADIVAYFDGLDAANGDVLVATGWALAEDLEKYL